MLQKIVKKYIYVTLLLHLRGSWHQICGDVRYKRSTSWVQNTTACSTCCSEALQRSSQAAAWLWCGGCSASECKAVWKVIRSVEKMIRTSLRLGLPNPTYPSYKTPKDIPQSSSVGFLENVWNFQCRTRRF